MKKTKSLYPGHRFPATVISHAVRWYFRFHLSLRDIEELLFERGVTDQLRGYPAAKAEIPELANVKHVFVKASARMNNRAENSHQPTRDRERRMRGFRDPDRTQAFLSSFGPIRQHFALKRHLLRASLYRKQLAARFAGWQRFTGLTQDPSDF